MSLRLALLALAAALFAAAPASASAPRAIGAYAYMTKPQFKDDPAKGYLWVVVRTTSALQSKLPRLSAGPFGGEYLDTISPRLHCYGDQRFVPATSHVGPGSSIRLLVAGKGGPVLDTRVVVQRFRPRLAYGRPLGCGADVTTHAWTSNMAGGPVGPVDSEPLAADAGPALTFRRWAGWGTRRAVGYGIYDNRCADCTGGTWSIHVIYTRPRLDLTDGYRYYTRECWVEYLHGHWSNRRAGTHEPCTKAML